VKVAFLVNDLQLAGGVGVVVKHASLLRELHGFDAELVLARHGEHLHWGYEELESVPVRTLDEARRRRYDVAVATWWQTTAVLFELDALRYAYFVQSLEDRFYEPQHAVYSFDARKTFDLPVAFLTEASWIAQTLRALRPDAPCFYVRNGIDKTVFAPLETIAPRLEGPLRVLVEGHANVWFKGVPDALAAAAAMREPRVVTAVTPGPAVEGADRVVGPLTPREMADAYAETDVVLKLSRVEGMYGPPLEGFHRGATCVTTPVTGHDEYVVHGWNGLLVDWDDIDGTARALDLLARDRRLLHFLRANALATARAWPGWEQSSQFMALALQSLARRPAVAARSRAEALQRVRVDAYGRSVTASAGPPPTERKAELLERLWANRCGALLLRLYGSPVIHRPLRGLVRRLIR